MQFLLYTLFYVFDFPAEIRQFLARLNILVTSFCLVVIFVGLRIKRNDR